jgi:hypothetical protein
MPLLRITNAIVPQIGKFIFIMRGRMRFAPTITGTPHEIGFKGENHP